GGVDAAVVVEVGYFARADVDRVVQVPERDEAVVVHVHEVFQSAFGDLGLVDPDVQVQVGVVVVDAGVHHRHDDPGVAGGDLPGRGGVAVRPGGAAVLARVVHVPLRAELRVVGDGRRAEQVVRLGRQHLRVGAVGGQRLGDRGGARQVHLVQARDQAEG